MAGTLVVLDAWARAQTGILRHASAQLALRQAAPQQLATGARGLGLLMKIDA